ncbi:MAG: pyridoxamine 5'-phosphate oxidase family protein [Oscillospiraceae bacterium]|nr:pyridoxamine 5'-phosphate oxidase family protein [Oscillospiraceae bacterium]
MRRKDREKDAAFAWEVFDRAPYAVLSMRDEEGGYGVPVSPARIGGKVYFHCAQAGKKLDCLSQWPQASLTAVTDTAPDYFSCNYRSAILRGKVSLVEDEGEKTEALRAISRRHCPGDMADFDRYLVPRLKTTAVCRMDVAEITGKERMPK